MTKSELIDRLAAQFPQLVAKDAKLAVKMILDAMAESLAKGERIEIRGFGSFEIRHYKAYEGRNPRTGERVMIPETIRACFRPSQALTSVLDRLSQAAGKP